MLRIAGTLGRSAHRLHQIVDRACRDALDVGFLDHRHQRLLRRPARLQEAREVAAPPQLGDRQLDPARTRVPVAVAVAVAVVQAVGRAGACRRPRPRLNLQVHHALGSKRQHLAHQVGIRLLLDQLGQGHLGVGHRRLLQVRVRIRTLAEDQRWPPHPGPLPTPTLGALPRPGVSSGRLRRCATGIGHCLCWRRRPPGRPA